MDHRDRQFPALSPDEGAGDDVLEDPPTGSEAMRPLIDEAQTVIEAGLAGSEHPPGESLGFGDESDESFRYSTPSSWLAAAAGPAAGQQASSEDSGTARVEGASAGGGAHSEPSPRRDGGRGAHRAKVSWVGRTDRGQAERRGWRERVTHAVTGAAASRRPGSEVVGETSAVSFEPAQRQTAGEPGLGSPEEAPAPGASAPEAAATAGATAADPRDEVVFVRASPGPQHLEADGLGSEEAGGAVEPVFPVASRRSPIVATATGVGIGLVALLCFLAGPAAALVLTSLVLTVAMAECYRAFQRAGYRPAVALGLIAAPGAAIAAYFGGPVSISLVGAFLVVATFCWYLAGVTRRSPVLNLGATIMGWTWIGLLGAFAGLLLDPAAFPHRAGVALLLGAVEATVAYDVGGYLFGSWLGKRPMLPRISPKKTWEGLLGGCAAAFVVSVVVVSQMSPWSYQRGALLGLVVVVLAPLGDLAESMVKRDLGLKDMGSLLPAHGGALDRVDGLLFVLPATYCLVRLLHW